MTAVSTSQASSMLALLQNTSWIGSGVVRFPTMPNEVLFGCQLRITAPEQKTKSFFLQTFLESWKAGKRGEMGMHYENGFLRIAGDTKLNWCIAHNFGVTEVADGVVEWETESAEPTGAAGVTRKMVFNSSHIGNAALVQATRREILVTVDPATGKPTAMRDVMYMATPDVPSLTEHLVIDYKPGE